MFYLVLFVDIGTLDWVHNFNFLKKVFLQVVKLEFENDPI